MQCGPESAGAVPGPVCNDQGGEDPTITDANVILGYINSDHLMGGELALNTERGRDPRRYTMFAFGGNGPLFAATMAAALHMKRILVSPAPGLFSTFGLLYADVEHHYSRTFRRVLVESDPVETDRAWRALEDEGRSQLEHEGFGSERMQFRCIANLHYKGQLYELNVAVPPLPASGAVGRAWLEQLAEALGEEHERTYGHRAGRRSRSSS